MGQQIRKINADTRSTFHFAIGETGANSLGGTNTINSICVSQDGTLYAGGGSSEHIVYKIFEDGRVLGALDGKYGTAGDLQAQGLNASTGLVARLTVIASICTDSSGNIFAADSDSATYSKIKRISKSGRCIDFVGATLGDVVSTSTNPTPPAGQSQPAQGWTATPATVLFNTPLGLEVDATGNLYVADQVNNKIKKVFQDGKTVVLAGGTSSQSGNVNGNGNTARFNAPSDVCVGPDGKIYVCDSANNRIRQVDPAGNVVTIAGGASGFVDGQGNSALFNNPQRICMSPSGRHMYVLDHGNKAVRKVATDGAVTTLCNYNATAVAASDIAMDKSGFIYILERAV